MKDIAIFTSSGDNDTFGKYAIENLSDDCDIFINYYGKNYEDFLFFKNHATFCSMTQTTKFVALHQIYQSTSIKQYNCVYVFDDDCVLIDGNLLDLYQLMMRYNLKLIAPSQSDEGKVNISIMRHQSGNHIIRYTNFIEMNFPVFSQQALSKYMEVYDGQLCGWGNDWWFCRANNSHIEENCAVCDNIIVKNPTNNSKKHTYGLLTDHTYSDIQKSDIDNYMTKGDRRNQWIGVMINHRVREWDRKTLRYVY